MTVPANQLSLAIGNKGQNAKLAARLTGYKIDIVAAQTPVESADENMNTNAADALDASDMPDSADASGESEENSGDGNGNE